MIKTTTLVIVPLRRAAARPTTGVRYMSAAATAAADSIVQKPTTVIRKRDKPRVVVLGTGWGSFALAKNLDRESFDVHVVSPRNHMLFTPLLASTSVGTLEFRGVAEPVRSSLPEIDFHLGKCRNVDPERKTVTVVTKPDRPSNAVFRGTVPTTTYELEYDALVVGVGARSNTFGIEGVAEHVHFLKELSDARGIRKGITECLEAAAHASTTEEEKKRLLQFVVVGGGPTGVEFSAELSDFVHQDLHRYYPTLAPDIKITLIEGHSILGSFNASLREYASKRLKSGRVDVRTGANVHDLTATCIHLDDGTEIPYGLCVWSTGVGPRKLLTLLDGDTFAMSPQRRLCTDPMLRVFKEGAVEFKKGGGFKRAGRDEKELLFDGVYALGDCADVERGHYAPIAQVAERQGKYLANQLNSLVQQGKDVGSEGPEDRFEYKHTASLAYLGSYTALSDFTNSDYGGVKGAKLTGAASWFFWRSAYLSSLGSWRNRFQVPFDWARTMVFGRDINSF